MAATNIGADPDLVRIDPFVDFGSEDATDAITAQLLALEDQREARGEKRRLSNRTVWEFYNRSGLATGTFEEEKDRIDEEEREREERGNVMFGDAAMDQESEEQGDGVEVTTELENQEENQDE